MQIVQWDGLGCEGCTGVYWGVQGTVCTLGWTGVGGMHVAWGAMDAQEFTENSKTQISPKGNRICSEIPKSEQ